MLTVQAASGPTNIRYYQLRRRLKPLTMAPPLDLNHFFWLDRIYPSPRVWSQPAIPSSRRPTVCHPPRRHPLFYLPRLTNAARVRLFDHADAVQYCSVSHNSRVIPGFRIGHLIETLQSSSKTFPSTHAMLTPHIEAVTTARRTP